MALKSGADKMIEGIKSPNLWLTRLRNPPIVLPQRSDLFHPVHGGECKCRRMSKAFFSSAVSKEQLLVEPLNHSTFARRHSFEM